MTCWSSEPAAQGLRAVAEACKENVSVGLICKSLLGKAHTVMAEGGILALANVDDRDNWKVHFADTMRGGQYLNNWRMAELHARKHLRERTEPGRPIRSHK
jgi:succinate dehydrogenase / fumarate reductase flavoprotein subunit